MYLAVAVLSLVSAVLVLAFAHEDASSRRSDGQRLAPLGALQTLLRDVGELRGNAALRASILLLFCLQFGMGATNPLLELHVRDVESWLGWLEPSTALFGLFGGGGGAWWWIIGAPALIHGAGQILDDYILTPRIQGQSTGMDTPTILFASLAGAVLAGFYGVLLAIPVAACVKIALQRLFWPRFKAWAAGRASDPLPLKE